jgi:triosephosphate isomerase (TIM)
MRRSLIAGNWKMHKTHLEAIVIARALGHELATHRFDAVEVALCPPFTSLRTLQTLFDADHLPFSLGAQDMHSAPQGAFTGEISATMLKSLHVDYVIVGHSERRGLFGESDEDVNAKVKAALAAGLTPIMCCGEKGSERDQGATRARVERQVGAGLEGIEPNQGAAVVIAYEPIWAIGTGKTPTPQDAQDTISYIRGVVERRYSSDVAERIRILYGGSVKAGNAAALMSQQDIDGALVGGASLDPAEFASIVKSTDS